MSPVKPLLAKLGHCPTCGKHIKMFRSREETQPATVATTERTITDWSCVCGHCNGVFSIQEFK